MHTIQNEKQLRQLNATLDNKKVVYNAGTQSYDIIATVQHTLPNGKTVALQNGDALATNLSFDDAVKFATK